MRVYSLLSLVAVVGATASNSFHRELQGEVEPLPRPVPVPVDNATPLRAGVAERISAFTHALRDGLEARKSDKGSLRPAAEHSYRPAVTDVRNVPRHLAAQFRERQRGNRIPPNAQTWQQVEHPKMAPKAKPHPMASQQRIASWAGASEPAYEPSRPEPAYGAPPPPPQSPDVQQVQDACYEDYQYYCTFHTLPAFFPINDNMEEAIPCNLRGAMTVTAILVPSDDDDTEDDDDDYWTFNDADFQQSPSYSSSSSSSSSSGASWMSSAIPLGYGVDGDACLYDNYDMLSSECQSAIEDYNEASSSSHHFFIPALLLVILVLSLLACRLRRLRQRYEPMQAIIAAINNNPELKSQVEAAAGVQMPPAPASRPPLYLCVFRVIVAFVLSFVMVHVAVNIALNRTPTDGSNTLAMFTFLGWFLLVLLVEMGVVCAIKFCCKKCYKCCCSDSAPPATDAPTLRSRVLAYVRRQAPPTGYAPLAEEETELSQLSTTTAAGPPYCVVLAHGTEATAPASKPYATPTIVSAHSLSNVTII